MRTEHMLKARSRRPAIDQGVRNPSTRVRTHGKTRTGRWGSRLIVGVAVATGSTACTTSHGGPDQAAITELLVRHYKSPSCDDLTAAARTAFGHPVEDAACAQDIEGQESKQVSVTKVKVHGTTASAVADRFTFKLRRIKGRWLIDG